MTQTAVHVHEPGLDCELKRKFFSTAKFRTDVGRSSKHPQAVVNVSLGLVEVLTWRFGVP